MNVLIISLDKSLFEINSKSQERFKEYSHLSKNLFVIVFTLKNYETIKVNNLAIIATASKNKFFYFIDAFKLSKRIMNESKIDLIVTQDPFETGIIGWFLKRKFKIPWQCQVHTDFLSPYFKKEFFLNKIRVLAGKFLIKKADNIRAVSRRIKNSLIKIGVNEEKIFVLPIISNIKDIVTKPIQINLHKKYSQFKNILLVASRLSKEKNIELVIKTMPIVLKNNPATGLIIVGSGPEEEKLKRRVVNYKLQKNVIFEPWTKDLISYYKTADIFILTSNYEGWAMTVIEAAASGCPIIMTNVGCAEEIIKNNESGIIIPVQNQKILEQSIIKLINNEFLRKKISENAKKAVSKLPSQKEYLEIYKQSWQNLIKKQEIV